jgi:hypothetical protein
MKPLWTQTIAWIAAAVAAFLLALVNPDALDFTGGDSFWPQGAMTPH